MKPHSAYMRQGIDKYLKFKREDRQAPAVLPKEPQSSAFLSLPIVVNGKLAAPSHQANGSAEGNNRAIIDRIQMVKQKYLKRSAEDKLASTTHVTPQSQNISPVKRQNISIQANPSQQQERQITVNKPLQGKSPNAQLKHVTISKISNEILLDPSRSSIVKQIILKRLKETFEPSSSTSLSQDCDQNDDENSQADPFSNEIDCKAAKSWMDMPFDEEYIDASATCDLNTVSQEKSRSLEEQIHLWLHSPANLISENIPNGFASSPSKFTFTSTNKSFTPAIAQIIEEFVLKGKNDLGEGQRRALYHIALEYFYRNASELTADLLIVLVKLGNRYLTENSQFFTHNVEKYCTIILSNKSLFSVEEKIAIVNFLVEQGPSNEHKIGCLLLVHPTENLIRCLFSKAFQARKILFLLSCLNLSRRQFPNLTEAYFRLMDSLLDSLPREKEIIEEVLAHVTDISTNENYYQYQKQVKLRLIQLLSDGQGKARPEKREGVSNRFIGYWAQAVGKIKIATAQFKE